MKLRITIAGNTYEAEVELVDEGPAAVDDSDAMPEPSAVVPPRLGIPGALEAAGSSLAAESVCRSPVTGIVIRVHVEQGQAVEPAQTLMVVEGMKMETQIAAPCAGRVQAVHAAVGSAVKAGQVLVELG